MVQGETYTDWKQRSAYEAHIEKVKNLFDGKRRIYRPGKPECNVFLQNVFCPSDRRLALLALAGRITVVDVVKQRLTEIEDNFLRIWCDRGQSQQFATISMLQSALSTKSAARPFG